LKRPSSCKRTQHATRSSRSNDVVRGHKPYAAVAQQAVEATQLLQAAHDERRCYTSTISQSYMA
jgi:hypothetical protein